MHVRMPAYIVCPDDRVGCCEGRLTGWSNPGPFQVLKERQRSSDAASAARLRRRAVSAPVVVPCRCLFISIEHCVRPWAWRLLVSGSQATCFENDSELTLWLLPLGGSRIYCILRLSTLQPLAFGWLDGSALAFRRACQVRNLVSNSLTGWLAS